MLPPDTVFKLVPNPTAGARDINLAADEWRVLTMINGKNRLTQIAQRTGLGMELVSEIAERLMLHGLILLQGGQHDLQQIEREFEAWYQTDGAKSFAKLFPKRLTPNEERMLARKLFFSRRPELGQRHKLAAIGQQLVDELLRYRLVLNTATRRRVPAEAPQIIAKLEDKAAAIERGCARLLGECGLIALRMGLIEQDQALPDLVDDEDAWLWQLPMENFAGAIIMWYSEQLEELAGLYEQLLADDDAIGFIPEHATPPAAAHASQGELRSLPGLDDTPDPTTALRRLFDQLPALERRLHKIILTPPGDDDEQAPIIAPKR
jgi:hypothetical protein